MSNKTAPTPTKAEFLADLRQPGLANNAAVQAHIRKVEPMTQEEYEVHHAELKRRSVAFASSAARMAKQAVRSGKVKLSQ